MMVRCPRHTKVPWVEKNQNIRPISVVALNMSTGSPEASSAILHHKIRICLVGASGCAARPRSVSQQGWSESLKKEKKILVWKSGRKTLVSFWKMSTGWHTPLRGSFENVVIVLTPPFFFNICFAGRPGNLLKCLFSFTFCVSLQGFHRTLQVDKQSKQT